MTAAAVSPENIVLLLTPEEAQTLADITQVVGGSPSRSRRRHVDAIADALRRVGFEAESDPEYDYRASDIEPSPAVGVYFAEEVGK